MYKQIAFELQQRFRLVTRLILERYGTVLLRELGPMGNPADTDGTIQDRDRRNTAANDKLYECDSDMFDCGVWVWVRLGRDSDLFLGTRNYPFL